MCSKGGGTIYSVAAMRHLLVVASILVLGAVGCGSTLSEEAQTDEGTPLVPVIRADAFRNDTAITLLGPEAGAFNDHALVQDASSTWHLFAIADPTGSFGQLNSLAHATATGFPALMTRHENVLSSKMLGTCAVLAPHIIFHEGTAHMFYSDTRMCDDFAQHVFAMRLATASPDNLFDWVDQGELFKDTGYSRDPFLFFDSDAQEWLIYYHRKLDPGVNYGISAISYKTSRDLIVWSDETYDAIGNIPDTQILPGAAESPQVILHRGFYYLFLTHPILHEEYADTYVYRSKDPRDFGSFEDQVTILWTHAPEILKIDGQHFITHAGDPEAGQGPDDFRTPGVEAAFLDWVEVGADATQ